MYVCIYIYIYIYTHTLCSSHQCTWDRSIYVYSHLVYLCVRTTPCPTNADPVTPNSSHGDWFEPTEISLSLSLSLFLSRSISPIVLRFSSWPHLTGVCQPVDSRFVFESASGPKAQLEIRNGVLWVPDKPHAGPTSGRLDRFEAFEPRPMGDSRAIFFFEII